MGRVARRHFEIKKDSDVSTEFGKLEVEREEARTHRGKLRLLLENSVSANVTAAAFGTSSDVQFDSSDRTQSLDDKLEQAKIIIALQTAHILRVQRKINRQRRRQICAELRAMESVHKDAEVHKLS